MKTQLVTELITLLAEIDVQFELKQAAESTAYPLSKNAFCEPRKAFVLKGITQKITAYQQGASI